MEQSSAQHNHHKPCLSVITTQNTPNSPHNDSHSTQNLKVKTFPYFQNKNEDYQPFPTDEDAPRSSISTSASAATPHDLISAYFRCENSAGLTFTPKKEEEAFSPEKSPEKPEREQVQPENPPLSAEAIISNFINSTSANNNNEVPDTTTATSPLTESTPANEVNNTENNGTEATRNIEGPTINLADGLEFIMDKTPVISIFMSLICLSLISGIGLSYLEGKSSQSFLFIILYVFLIYLLVGNVLKLIRAHGRNTVNILALIKGEPLYNVMDVTGLISITLLADLRLAGAISSLNVGLSILTGTLGLYCIFSRVPLKNKIIGVVKRLFPILQLLAIIYKAESETPISWKMILCSGWMILGGFALKLTEGIVHILTAFQGQNSLSAISKTAKIVSVLGLFLLMIDLVVLMMVLVGVCRVLDAEEPEMETLKHWLTVSQYLNAALLFYSTITGADLLDFILTATEYFTQIEKIAARLRQLVTSKQETYICRVSPTYYKMINESEINKEDSNVKGNSEEENNDHEGFEDNVCYICCNKTADGVIVDCGHGGICYDCLIDYIGRKDGCMECRNKIQSVVKIEKEVRTGKIFKGEQVTKIMRPVDNC